MISNISNAFEFMVESLETITCHQNGSLMKCMAIGDDDSSLSNFVTEAPNYSPMYFFENTTSSKENWDDEAIPGSPIYSPLYTIPWDSQVSSSVWSTELPSPSSTPREELDLWSDAPPSLLTFRWVCGLAVLLIAGLGTAGNSLVVAVYFSCGKLKATVSSILNLCIA